ncbi:hypothetical protein RUM43_002814 [Polyplax serrata]|uniref:Uncharacterized protein n=1 Tax=Polyplax serrata TaxID=468196 RepID=A0AAN8PEH5_POLSC
MEKAEDEDEDEGIGDDIAADMSKSSESSDSDESAKMVTERRSDERAIRTLSIRSRA